MIGDLRLSSWRQEFSGIERPRFLGACFGNLITCHLYCRQYLPDLSSKTERLPPVFGNRPHRFPSWEFQRWT